MRRPRQTVSLITLLVLFSMMPIGGAQWSRLAAHQDGLAGNSAPSSAPFVVRIYYDDIADLTRLESVDLWEYNNLDERYVLGVTEYRGYAKLQEQGWNVVIDSEATDQFFARGLPESERTFYGGYRTVSELYAGLEALASENLHLSALVPYGESHCLTRDGCTTPGGDQLSGFPLLALRITNEDIPGSSVINGAAVMRGTKPIFFLMAGTHSREITTPEIAMRLIEELLSGYGKDANTTWLVDYNEIWVVPAANPDGHRLVELGMSPPYSGLPFYQRKNANNDDNRDGQPDCLVWPPTSYEQYGIDLNRNHSFGWGPPGSSADPCDMTYRGASAASEPETAALETLLQGLFADQRGPELDDPAPENTSGILITLHSFSNLVLWPWGNSTAPAPNKADLKAIGDKFASYNNYLSCQPTFCLYLTTGAVDDWAYGELGIPAYTFEIGDQFMPPYSEIDSRQWPDNRPALIYAAKIARSPYLSVRGPDVADVVVSGESAQQIINATIDDSHNGDNAVVAAAYSIDVPVWEEGAIMIPLQPLDGAFDSAVEVVTGTIYLSNLAPGKHTLFLHGQNASDQWGPMSAAFFVVDGTWSFEKVALKSYGTPGDMIPYTINLKVNRPGNSNDYVVTITDTLPSELAAAPESIMVNGIARPELYDPGNRTIAVEATGTFDDSWNLSLTYLAQVNQATPAGSIIVNEAFAQGTINGDPVAVTSATAAVPIIQLIAAQYLPVAITP